MRAVVIIANSELSRPGTGALPILIDRPFAQHVVESIVDRGGSEIHLIWAQPDKTAEALFGDGGRWGANFYHHSHSATGWDNGHAPYDLLDTFSATPEEVLLLAHADRLPLLPANVSSLPPALFCWREGQLGWSGWAMVRSADLQKLPKGLDENTLFTFLAQTCRYPLRTEGRRPLAARTYEDLIDASTRVLVREYPGLLISGKETQPGVWLGRNTAVHPTARLIPPVYLGENSMLKAMTQVGPRATIGRDCVIDRETVVSDSVVCGGSYVGRQLALHAVVVDRSLLVNTKWSAEIEGVDELLLGSVMTDRRHKRWRRLGSRVAAAVTFVAVSPMLFAMYSGSVLGIVPRLRNTSMVRTPAVADVYRWRVFPLWSFGWKQIPTGSAGWLRHFFLYFLPALPAIALGYLDFVGVAALTSEDAAKAEPGERGRFLRSRSGVLDAGLFADQEQQGRNARDDSSGLLGRYLFLVLRNCFSAILPAAERRHAE